MYIAYISNFTICLKYIYTSIAILFIFLYYTKYSIRLYEKIETVSQHIVSYSSFTNLYVILNSISLSITYSPFLWSNGSFSV